MARHGLDTFCRHIITAVGCIIVVVLVAVVVVVVAVWPLLDGTISHQREQSPNELVALGNSADLAAAEVEKCGAKS